MICLNETRIIGGPYLASANRPKLIVLELKLYKGKNMKLLPILCASFVAFLAALTQRLGWLRAGRRITARPERAEHSDRNCHRNIKTTLAAIFSAALAGTQFCAPAAAQNIVYNQPLPGSLINVNSNFTSSGDGYVAIPYKDRFYLINHHQSMPTGNIFGCIQKDPSVVFCAGFGALQASTTNFYKRTLPDGDSSSPLVSSTSGAPEEYFIDGAEKLYYAVTRFAGNAGSQPQDWGLGCFDLQNNTECGYRSLSNNPSNRAFAVGVEGPFQIGGKLYLLDLEMRLYCVDPSTMAVCQPSLDLSLAANGGLPKFVSSSPGYNGHIGGRVVSTNLYLTVAYDGSYATFNPAGTNAKRVICIDTVAWTKCPLWTAGAATFANMENYAVYNYSNYLWFNSAGTPKYICNRGQAAQSCVDLNSGVPTTSPANVVTGSLSYGLGGEVHIGSRSYFPSWLGESIFCYDFAISAVCSGWTSSGMTTPVAVSPARNYALSVDGSGCMWALGDNNKLWSLDPITRVAPCNRGKFAATATHKCDVRTWQEFKISGITASDYDTLEVRIKDKNGIWQTFTYSGGATFSIPLTGAAFNPLSPLEFEVVAYFASGVTTYHTQPVITIAETDEACPDDRQSVLKLCKVAGTGVTVGTPFTFNAWSATGGGAFSVPAGPAPGGYCKVVGTFAQGTTVNLWETIPPGFEVSNIQVVPQGNIVVAPVLSQGTVSVTTGSGVTEVTYTDENNNGYLEICKAGDVTGDYTFSVNGGPPITVPAGACSPPIAVIAGSVVIHEQSASGSMVACSTYPASRQGPCNPGARTSTVTVVPGDISTETIATVTNRPKGIPHR
jgi:hypothetical protein